MSLSEHIHFLKYCLKVKIQLNKNRLEFLKRLTQQNICKIVKISNGILQKCEVYFPTNNSQDLKYFFTYFV